MKKQFQIEFVLNCSINLLFERVSTDYGLSEWFADKVVEKDGIFTFIWGKSEQIAEMVSISDEGIVRFHWQDEDEEGDEETYFEFKIEQDEITKEISLIVTDFAEEDEVEDSIELWESQLNKLKRELGA
jgi:hypothetical protein